MRLAAESLGIGAAEILRLATPGTVIAVFTRSLYLRFPAGLICLGGPGIGRGPLNLPCRTDATCQWQSAAKPSMQAIVDSASINVGSLRISLEEAGIWSPPPTPVWSGKAVEFGISSLRTALPINLPEGGLSAILTSPEAAHRSENPVMRAAIPAIDTLLRWIMSGKSSGPSETAIGNLLGLGPGLTPSGDDFLGGVLVALRLAGRTRATAQIGRTIERLGPDRTNEISLAHLRAVIQFGLTEKLHRVASEILRGTAGGPHASLAQLSQVSHHSPWDTLAGLTSTFEALCRQSTLEPRIDRSIV